jgi:hypothetical protein
MITSGAITRTATTPACRKPPQRPQPATLPGSWVTVAIVMCVIPVPFMVLRTSLTRIGRELPAATET